MAPLWLLIYCWFSGRFLPFLSLPVKLRWVQTGYRSAHVLLSPVVPNLRLFSRSGEPGLCWYTGLTSVCICELSSPQEPQVACPCPDGLCVSKTQPRVEVIWLQGFISINGKISTGVVGTVNPDLQTEQNVTVDGLAGDSWEERLGLLYSSAGYIQAHPTFP